LTQESLQLQQEMGRQHDLASTLVALGQVVARAGDPEAAGILLQHSLSILRKAWDRYGIAECLEALARIAVTQRRPEATRAARLMGAAEALREAIGAPLPPSDRPDYQRHVTMARAALGPAVFHSASAEGRTMSVEQGLLFGVEESASDHG
jgi:hypothetical protein